MMQIVVVQLHGTALQILTSTSILVLQILESPQRVVSLYNYMHMIESN